MSPPNPSAAHQAILANYIRDPDHAPKPEGIDDKRLAVYHHLVRANLASFLNRCFSATLAILGEGQWQALQTRFLQKAQAQSPYFRDIPAQFLHFVQTENSVSDGILALMDFEHHQLLAEIAPNRSLTPTWGKSDLLQGVASAFILSYEQDFISSDLQAIEAGRQQLVVWRNPTDEVYYQAIASAEYELLAHFFTQADSYQQLCQALAAEIDDLSPYQQWLEKHLNHWVAAGVLQPVDQASHA